MRLRTAARNDLVRFLDSYASLLVLLVANFFLLELVDDPRWGAIGSTLLSENGYTADNGYHAVAFGTELRAIVGTAVYLAVVALFSLGVTAMLRHTAAAISTVFAVLWVPLIVISMLPMDVGLKLGRFFPMLAGLAIQRSTDPVDAIPIAPGVGLLVACSYAAAALAAGAWLLARRDA